MHVDTHDRLPPIVDIRPEEDQRLNVSTTSSHTTLAEPASVGLCRIVLACDEGYAMPLATTLLSLAESNTRHWPLRVTVLHDGFGVPKRELVSRSLPPGAVDLTWQQIALTEFAGFAHPPWVSPMTFARIVLEKSVGTDVGRVLFLDSDILVLDDLADLATADLGGRVIGAVADAYIDDALRNGLRPEHAGVPRVAGYFNAGVLVIDLPMWRQHEIAGRTLRFLVENDNLPYGDQDALNAACDGLWTPLPQRWNFQRHFSARIDSLPATERPAIVHFITQSKPWKPSSASVNSRLYNAVRDRTAFRRTPAERVSDHVSTLAYRIKYRIERNLRSMSLRAAVATRSTH